MTGQTHLVVLDDPTVDRTHIRLRLDPNTAKSSVLHYLTRTTNLLTHEGRVSAIF